MVIPDLEEGDFQNITISRQLKLVESLLDRYSDKRFGLIGSSLGGYLAVLLAEANLPVAGIYLMAPAFEFFNRWRIKLDSNPDIKSVSNFINIFHSK